jgi:hypothetical protein
MSRKIVFVVVSALLLAACSANTSEIFGSGKVITEERSLEGVRRVTLATLGDLTVELGEPASITIEAEDNLLPALETNVRAGTLTIRNKLGANLHPTEPVRYHLIVPSLEALSLTSSGNAEAPALQAKGFSLRTTSSGNIYLAGLDADTLSVDMTSGGNVEIAEGRVTEQTAELKSSGAYEAGNLRSDRARITVRSGGSATVWAGDTLRVTLSSSGNVRYYGHPMVTQSVSSSGGLVALGDK